MSTIKKQQGNDVEVTVRALEDFRIAAQQYQEFDRKPSFLNFCLTEMKKRTREHSDNFAFQKRLLENSLAIVVIKPVTTFEDYQKLFGIDQKEKKAEEETVATSN